MGSRFVDLNQSWFWCLDVSGAKITPLFHIRVRSQGLSQRPRHSNMWKYSVHFRGNTFRRYFWRVCLGPKSMGFTIVLDPRGCPNGLVTASCRHTVCISCCIIIGCMYRYTVCIIQSRTSMWSRCCRYLRRLIGSPVGCITSVHWTGFTSNSLPHITILCVQAPLIKDSHRSGKRRRGIVPTTPESRS